MTSKILANYIFNLTEINKVLHIPVLREHVLGDLPSSFSVEDDLSIYFHFFHLYHLLLEPDQSVLHQLGLDIEFLC